MTPTTWARASPPSAAGETSRSSARDLLVGVARLDEVEHRGRGGQVAVAQPRAELGGARHADDGGAVALRHQRHDVAHDLRQVEVLGRVDRRDAGRLQRLDVGLGDDPADDDRRVDAAVAQRLHHGRDQLAVRAREDRQADDVDALLQRAGGDLRRRQPDALVDDVHADVAGAHGDLLGAVGVPVEARLADEDLQPPPDRLADAVDLVAQLLERRGVGRAGRRLADAGGRAVLAEGLAQRAGPLAGGRARAARRRSSPA